MMQIPMFHLKYHDKGDMILPAFSD